MAWLSSYGPDIHKAIKCFVQVAFKTQDSLFTPGTKIWSSEVRADLCQRLARVPDDSGGGDFMQNFEKLLRGSPSKTIQLAAELLYVQSLIPTHGTIKFGTKLQYVETVRGWSAEPVIPLTDALKAGLNQGLSRDMAFVQRRPAHLKFILDTLQAWWSDDIDDARHDELLREPWEFKEFLGKVPAKSAQAMRETLCFFVHPSHFEAITSFKKKKEFVKDFSDRLKSSTGDDDKDLLAIREVLSKEYGKEFHFFESEIRGDRVANGRDSKEREDEATMKALLEQFGQIIVYGPPGTGKTREAKRVALALLDSTVDAASTDDDIEKQLKNYRDADRFDLVVFHPAYEYEQFVGGIEPTLVGQQLCFQAKAGVFTRLCRKAQEPQNDSRSAVLIIDEINRGNLPKLLGELVYALEYRGHQVTLPFICDGRTDLIVPKNLYIIATMNSADRSIGHIDIAIRRRFGLYPLEPKSEVVRQVWSGAGDPDYGAQLADLMERVNKTLGSSHDPSAAVELGVGHSYFLPAPGSSIDPKKQVGMKWTYQVQPLLREYAQLLNLGTESLKKFSKPLDECLHQS